MFTCRMTLQVKSSRSAPSADTQTDDESGSVMSVAVTAGHDTELTLTAEEGVIFAKKLSEINPRLDVDQRFVVSFDLSTDAGVLFDNTLSS